MFSGKTGKYKPTPLTNITAAYKQFIQPTMKTFLSSAISTENVPGGYIEEQMVFTWHHLWARYLHLRFFSRSLRSLVATQFRKRRVAFTFVNVAAALAGSDVPQRCMEMEQFKADMGEKKVLKLFPSGDGQFNCAYQSVNED